MKQTIVAFIMALLMVPSAGLAAGNPEAVGGFVLGKNIKHYHHRINALSAMPIRYREYLQEVEVVPDKNFTSGLIAYGNCRTPGKIVRIKLKYRNGNRKFYNRLLSRFKKRFGEPKEWRGDPFGVVLAWKWSFIGTDGRTVSLTLQHNTKDAEQKLGNAVKLSLTSGIEEERRCFKDRHTLLKDRYDEKQPGQSTGPVDWDTLIPK